MYKNRQLKKQLSVTNASWGRAEILQVIERQTFTRRGEEMSLTATTRTSLQLIFAAGVEYVTLSIVHILTNGIRSAAKTGVGNARQRSLEKEFHFRR